MTSTLTIEDQKKFKEDVEALKSSLTDILEFSKENLFRFNALRFDNYATIFLDIFARFRINIEGLLNLMDAFRNDYRLKVSINLILRAVCSDILTAIYLVTFYDKNDPDCIALKNELDLLRSEYYRSLKQVLEEEHSFLEFLDSPQKKTLAEKMEWFKKFANELLDENDNLKSKKQIRETTNPTMKEGLTDSGLFISEIEKFKRIKEKGLTQFGFAFIGFKYYSQFQHFNHASKSFIENNPLRDTFYMALTIDSMLMTIDIILQVTKTPNTEFTKEILTLRDNLAKHFA